MLPDTPEGLSQVELAKAIGVAQPIVSKYESGELRLHGELIVVLAGLLDVSADELLGLEPTARPQAPKDVSFRQGCVRATAAALYGADLEQEVGPWRSGSKQETTQTLSS